MPIGSSFKGGVLGGVDPVPESEDLHARYDATELPLSEGNSVSTWTDETGNGHDLTSGTAPTYVENGIGGNPVVRFNGVDDFLDVVFSAIPQPTTIFVVAQFQSVGSTVEVLFDSNSTSNRQTLYNDGDNSAFSLFAGNFINGPTHNTNPTIWSALFNGANSVGRFNGTQEISGDLGTQSLDGITVGSESNDSNYAEVDVAEILVYPQDKSDIFPDVESYLSNRWGIAI